MSDYKFQNRRDFLKYSLGIASSIYGLSIHAQNNLLKKKGIVQVSILYTNDTHSRIEPFPTNDTKYAGEGGFAKRSALVEKFRNENEEVLLLDAGDIFQGTPYFNYFHGELEYKLMSMMRYDATTFGNHDFDLGTNNLLEQLPHANFDFINCNYDFNDSLLSRHSKIVPFKIYKKNRIKIGVLGIGIELENLVEKRLSEGVRYLSPIDCANKISKHLKEEEKCDYIICLSHLGFKYNESKVSDIILAEQSRNIDLIIGGHTHTFLNEPVTKFNLEKKEVKITQVGWAGIWLGKIDLYFSHDNKNLHQSSTNHQIR